MSPRTTAELTFLAIINPTLAQELKTNGPPKLPDPSLRSKNHTAYRAQRAAILREKHPLRYLPGPISEVYERDLEIPVRDGSKITIRIYTPSWPPKNQNEHEKEREGRPLIVMYHEGGWTTGDLTDEEVNCRLFSRDLGAVCVNVAYRLAPEHPFPTWIEDSWDALKWCAKHITELGADPSKGFIIGGGSAGGNITAVLSHLARDEGLTPSLTGQYLCVPSIFGFLPPKHIPAKYRDEYLSHPLITPCRDPVFALPSGFLARIIMSLMKFILDLLPLKLLAKLFTLLDIPGDISSPFFTPFYFGKMKGGHSGLPPAYFQVCGLDPLRDDGLIYERILREEGGVMTRVDVYPGLGHYFWTNFPELEVSRGFVEDTVRGVRWLLWRGRKGERGCEEDEE